MRLLRARQSKRETDQERLSRTSREVLIAITEPRTSDFQSQRILANHLKNVAIDVLKRGDLELGAAIVKLEADAWGRARVAAIGSVSGYPPDHLSTQRESAIELSNGLFYLAKKNSKATPAEIDRARAYLRELGVSVPATPSSYAIDPSRRQIVAGILKEVGVRRR